MRRIAATACAAVLLAGCGRTIAWSALSPDHQLLVVAWSQRGRSCVLVGGRAAECRDGIALEGLVFSPRGNHVAYPARVGASWVLVRDGVPGRAWEGVASPVYSPDGSRLAYAAFDSGGWRVVVDDSAGARFDSLYAGTLQFDPTGARVGYAARRGDSALVVVDGIADRGWVGVGALAFSPDGAHVAYAARGSLGAVVVLDGRVVALHERVGGIALRVSGRHLAYAAFDGGSWRIHHDGTSGPAWDSVTAPVFSARGAHWVYVGYDAAGAAVMRDGSEAAREPWAANAVVTDSGKVVYLARREGANVVVDGTAAHPFDVLVNGSLVLLEDGRTWACLAGDRRRHQLFVVVDGLTERRPFDWSQVGQLARAGDAGPALRAWVVAEARMALARARP